MYTQCHIYTGQVQQIPALLQCVVCLDDLYSSGMLHNVDWYLVTGISGNLPGPYSKVKQFKKKERKAFFLDFLNLADFTGSLCRNIDK